jgi:hypothetical protein
LPGHLHIEKDKIEMILLQQAPRSERIIQAYGSKVGLPERGTTPECGATSQAGQRCL